MAGAFGITVLPGVGAATRAALAALDLHVTSDLLRTNRQGLAGLLPGLSMARIRTRQNTSRLLEVEGITPEAGIALQADGVDSPAELTRRSLSRLRGALAGLALPPCDEALAAMLLNARTLDLTGVVNGTVLEPRGRPLAGVQARAGGQQTESDGRGRSPLLRLRPGRPVTLTLSHPTRASRIVRNVAVHPSSALVGRRFRMSGLTASSPPVPVRLSALRGDRLPPLGSAPITTEAQAGPPTGADLLAVIDFYANGDARAASLFLDFAEGRFVVRTYRIAAAALSPSTGRQHASLTPFPNDRSHDMSDIHNFQSSGDSCPICVALNGAAVPPDTSRMTAAPATPCRRTRSASGSSSRPATCATARAISMSSPVSK
jgi:hypothetical protein